MNLRKVLTDEGGFTLGELFGIPEKTHQGIVIIFDGKDHVTGKYSPVYYRFDQHPEFDRDTRQGQTPKGESIRASQWLNEPVSWDKITEIGNKMVYGFPKKP